MYHQLHLTTITISINNKITIVINNKVNITCSSPSQQYHHHFHYCHHRSYHHHHRHHNHQISTSFTFLQFGPIVWHKFLKPGGHLRMTQIHKPGSPTNKRRLGNLTNNYHHNRNTKSKKYKKIQNALIDIEGSDFFIACMPRATATYP